jgi:hypothetical protein
MQLKDEKVSENQKLRRLENQKVGGPLRYADGRRKTASLK